MMEWMEGPQVNRCKGNDCRQSSLRNSGGWIPNNLLEGEAECASSGWDEGSSSPPVSLLGAFTKVQPKTFGVRLFRGSFSMRKSSLNPVNAIDVIMRLEGERMIFPKPGNQLKAEPSLEPLSHNLRGSGCS